MMIGMRSMSSNVTRSMTRTMTGERRAMRISISRGDVVTHMVMSTIPFSVA